MLFRCLAGRVGRDSKGNDRSWRGARVVTAAKKRHQSLQRAVRRTVMLVTGGLVDGYLFTDLLRWSLK